MIKKIMYLNNEKEKTITFDEIQETINIIKSIVDENNLRLFIPVNRDYLTDQEYYELRALSRIFSDILNCTGFKKHLNEYKNNFDSTFFVGHFASYLIAHGFVVELEPTIPGLNKKPDIKAERNGIVFYFECKRPIENYRHDYQKEIFDCLKDYITNDYSLAFFFTSMPTFEKLVEIGDQIKQITRDVSSIYEGQILYEDTNENIRVEISGCQKFSEETELFISGIPVFNHYGYESACAINYHGKNIVFYKSANRNIIKNQLKKSKNKIAVDSNYIVAICTDDRRIVMENVYNEIHEIFKDPLNNDISGVVIANTILDEYQNFGLEITFHYNENALNDLSFLENFFANRVVKLY